MATLDAQAYAAHTTIAASVLRNGPATSVARTARESALAAKYHFRGIRYSAALRGNATNLNAPVPTAVVLEAQVRSALYQLVKCEVTAAQEAANAAGAAAAFDEDAARTTAAGSATNRIEAIALGAVHTALVQSYQITDADLPAAERGLAVLRAVAPAAAADQGAYTARLATPDAGWEIALVSGNAPGAIPAEENVMVAMASMTEAESEFAYGMFALGQAAPVRAGAQLFVDGHHYHSDPSSSARHRAIEKEVTGKFTAEALNIWKANVAIVRNAVWHAAVHPVSADVLQGFAEDNEMPARLNATGFGSMSVGLPAQEDLFNRAGSYIAVYNQVVQTVRAHGHSVSIDDLVATVTALQSLTRRGALIGGRPALPGMPAGPWPMGCNTRAKALKLFLEPALDIAEPVAAWMFGYYKEICSRAGIRATTQEGSLLRSYSLKRAMANFIGEANRAQEMYSARARYIRTQADQGNLETYTGNA